MVDIEDAYTLAKRVPDMDRGCVIHTAYGDIELTPEEAQQVARLVAQLIRQRLEASA